MLTEALHDTPLPYCVAEPEPWYYDEDDVLRWADTNEAVPVDENGDPLDEAYDEPPQVRQQHRRTLTHTTSRQR